MEINTERNELNKKYLKSVLLLHLMLMIYSMSSVFSKLAARQLFLSFGFFAYYAIIIALLCLYAIGWQQIIKRLPLMTAFSNKAVTIVWGIIWGTVFFHEPVSFGKIFGAALVMAGVVLFAVSDGERQDG